MAFIVGGYVLVNRRTLEAADVARSRLRGTDGSEPRWTLLKDDRISDVNFINRLLSGRAWVTAVTVQLTRAGWTMRPASFFLLAITCGIAGTLLGGYTTGALPALFFTVIGWAGPVIWLRWRQK